MEALFAQDTEDRLRQLEKEDNLTPWLKPKARAKEMVLPLSLILQPSLTDALKKGFTSKYGINAPQWAREATKVGDVAEVYEWKPEDFMRFVGTVVSPIAPK